MTQPTAWSAEGLLPYLPPEAQDRLFDNITALSAPGSRLATEHVPDPNAFSDERVQRITERWQRFGFDLNAADLFYRGERNVVVDYLTTHGWQVTPHPARELYAHNGFEFPEDEMSATFGEMSYVAATLRNRSAMVRHATRSRRQLGSGVQRRRHRDHGRGRARDGDEGSPRFDQRSVRRTLVRAVGVDFFTKMMDGELDLDAIENSSPVRVQAMIDGMAVRTKYFDDYFINATDAGVRQAVILASGLGLARLPVAVAGGDGGLRDRPAAGDRVQDDHVGRHRRRTHRNPAHRPDRSARRLADGAESGRIGYDGTDRVVGRGSADLPAAGSPGPVVRQHHRAQRARAARSPPNSCPASSISMPTGCGRCPVPSASTAWTSTWRRWSTPASATTSSTICGPRAGTSRA